MPEAKEMPGLTTTAKAQWPSPVKVADNKDLIDYFEPNSTLNRRVVKYLTDRLEYSEREMAAFYPRWRVAERKLQTYIDLPEWEKELKDSNDQGNPAVPVRITVPYSYATISTIVAFLMHTFTGRRPIFQVGSNKAESVEPARNMELALQYNADHIRLIRQMFQFFTDGESYGLGLLRVSWRDEHHMRTVRRAVPVEANGTSEPRTEMQKVRERRLVYSGNDVVSQDPFMFFPDPRVPMADVARRGEFVFWRTFEGLHMLKRLESSGEFKWVDYAGSLPRNFGPNESARSVLTEGRPHAGNDASSAAASKGRNFIQVDQGSVDIIPAELGLGPSENVEKWIFTMLNKKQIVQAAKMDDDHGRHPVVVAEPYSLGYGFGQPSMMDFLGPIQDIVSWFVNSHVDNVRRVLNDVMVVDPSAIELQDLKNPGPGAILRLKRSAMGRDVRSIIQQLNVQDVTAGHMKDAELMMIIGQRLSAVNDTLAGIAQQPSGRRTATEIRAKNEGAVSRLAAHARLYSAMALVDLTEMMSLNIQQYMDDQFQLELLGAAGAENPITLRPEHLVGDFHYPIHDGTIPLDRVALFELWNELFAQVQQDPALRQSYSVSQIFEHIAKLGGATNIESFRIDMKPDAEIEQEVQEGNMIGLPNSRQQGPAGQNIQEALQALGA